MEKFRQLIESIQFYNKISLRLRKVGNECEIQYSDIEIEIVRTLNKENLSKLWRSIMSGFEHDLDNNPHTIQPGMKTNQVIPERNDIQVDNLLATHSIDSVEKATSLIVRSHRILSNFLVSNNSKFLLSYESYIQIIMKSFVDAYSSSLQDHESSQSGLSQSVNHPHDNPTDRIAKNINTIIETLTKDYAMWIVDSFYSAIIKILSPSNSLRLLELFLQRHRIHKSHQEANEIALDFFDTLLQRCFNQHEILIILNLLLSHEVNVAYVGIISRLVPLPTLITVRMAANFTTIAYSLPTRFQALDYLALCWSSKLFISRGDITCPDADFELILVTIVP
jgi:hypothetical protein